MIVVSTTFNSTGKRIQSQVLFVTTFRDFPAWTGTSRTSSRSVNQNNVDAACLARTIANQRPNDHHNIFVVCSHCRHTVSYTTNSAIFRVPTPASYASHIPGACGSFSITPTTCHSVWTFECHQGLSSRNRSRCQTQRYLSGQPTRPVE